MARPLSGTSQSEPTPPEPVGGVAAPPDDGGHVGAYTVPGDVMNQAASVETRDRLDGASRANSAPNARFPLLGIIVVFLVLILVAWLTWRAGL